METISSIDKISFENLDDQIAESVKEVAVLQQIIEDNREKAYSYRAVFEKKNTEISQLTGQLKALAIEKGYAEEDMQTALNEELQGWKKPMESVFSKTVEEESGEKDSMLTNTDIIEGSKEALLEAFEALSLKKIWLKISNLLHEDWLKRDRPELVENKEIFFYLQEVYKYVCIPYLFRDKQELIKRIHEHNIEYIEDAFVLPPMEVVENNMKRKSKEDRLKQLKGQIDALTKSFEYQYYLANQRGDITLWLKKLEEELQSIHDLIHSYQSIADEGNN